MPEDTRDYQTKKRFFKQMLTLFGRNPVMEALQDTSLELFKLHLAESNKPSANIQAMIEVANNRGIEICYHSKQALSRISKNAKQDQGVALDIRCRNFKTFEAFAAELPAQFEAIALDRITNPQNLGMIARSVCASPITAMLIPEKGCAKLDSLVVKASAGTLFKTPIVHCPDLPQALSHLRQQQTDIFAMDANSTMSLAEFSPASRTVYVLGNETDGVSPQVQNATTGALRIPMANGVESLNVSVTAALLAFRGVIKAR